MRYVSVPILLLMLLAPAPAVAQMNDTGTLDGTAKDSTGQVLPGVTVTITSPALIRSQLDTVTDSKGYYRSPGLPPGQYTVTFALAGFRTLVRSGISVSAGGGTTLDVTVEISPIAETVVVTGESPTVDRTTVTLASNLSKEFIATIPTNRALVNTAFMLVPGATGDTYHGSSTRDNAYILDGVNISDPLNGTLLVSYSFDVMEDLSIQTGALSAEFGNVRGGVVNVVTKSGGNEFRGLGSFYYKGEALQSDNTKGTPFAGRFNGYDFERDTGVQLGGPVARNKIWFFGNGTWYSRQDYVEGYPYETQPINKPVDNQRLYPYMKLTWQVDPSDRLVFSYNHQNIRRKHRDAARLWTSDVSLIQDNPTETFNLQWTRLFSNNFLMNAKAAYVGHRLSFTAKNDLVRLYDAVTRVTTQSYGYDNVYERPKWQFLSDASRYFVNRTGRHEVKAGVEVAFGSESQMREHNRDPRWGLGSTINVNNGVPDYVTNYEDFARIDKSRLYGAFIQDKWNPVQALTVNVGFRFDHQEGIVPRQGQGRSPVTFGGRTYVTEVPTAFKPINWNTVSPRLGMAYRVTDDGKNVIKASFARYNMANVMDSFTLANPNGLVSWRNRLNPNWTLNGGPYLFSAPSEASVDPDIRDPYLTEFTVGFDREVIKDMRVSVRYIKKWDRNLIDGVDKNALDVAALKNGQLVWTNFTPVTTVDPVTKRAVTFYSVADTSRTSATYMTNPPGAERDYDGIEISVFKKLSDRWQMNPSYVWARSRGLVALSAGSDTSLWNNPNAHVNAFGRDNLERRHQFKWQGLYQAPWGINASGYLSVMSGAPYTRTIRSQDLGLKLSQGSVTINADPKGSLVLPAQTNLDLRAEKFFTLGKPYRKVGVMLDAFNVFNANTVAGVESISSTSTIVFQAPTSILAPRILRVGIRVEF